MKKHTKSAGRGQVTDLCLYRCPQAAVSGVRQEKAPNCHDSRGQVNVKPIVSQTLIWIPVERRQPLSISQASLERSAVDLQTVQGHLLSFAYRLNLWANHRYTVGAAAKSAAGIGTPKLTVEPTHALAWFFVGTRTSFLGAQLAYVVGSLYSVMAVRARASKEALVSFFTSYANLVRAATRRLASFCGSNKLLKKEAATMATVPTPATSKVFTFLIASSACRLADLSRIRTISTAADTEAGARAALAGLPLVFVSRRPSGEVPA